MAASNAKPFEVDDFSKGMTDDVFNQIPGTSEEIVNFLIGSDRKLKSRFGSVIESVEHAEVPSGTRVSGLVNYANNDKLFYASQRQLYYRETDSSFTELLGPTANHAFSESTPNAVPAFAQWNRHLYLTSDEYASPMKVFKDDAGVYQLRSSGLPAFTTEPGIAGAPGANSYLYAFYFSVEYRVFELTYQTVGPTKQVLVQNVAAPDVSPITITGLPVLANGLTQNYDLANIKIQIFRSVNGGTFLQKVAEVSNGTTSYVDTSSDTTVSDAGEPLYTNDGTVDFDPPPLHKFNHVVNNTGYYGYLKEGSEISPYKVRQGVPGVPDTGPLDFDIETEDELEGISSVKNLPILACKKFIYRVDGFFDQFGRGSAEPIRISDHAGCISHNSMVQAEGGLFWLGNDGVYYTDGYQVLKVSDQLNARYKSILKNTTQKNRIIGKYFEIERLIIWTIQRDSASFDNDSFLVLDLKAGPISPDMAFVFWNGRSFKPSSLEVFNGEIYRGDPDGFVLKHDEDLLDDQKVDKARAASLWPKETIIWKHKSINYNFGSTKFRKYPTRILLTAGDEGNTTIQISAINDDGRSTRNCKPIRNRRNFVWRDDDFVWRITDFVWRGGGLLEQWRRFPARNLRLSTMQIEITNGFSDITNSDTLGLAAFNGTTNKVTLSVPDRFWPNEAEDYYIYTELDDYVQGYLITLRDSNTVISASDPLNVLPTGSLKWVIRGYKKGEPLHLLSYSIDWTEVSQSQKTYDSSAASTGENA